MKGKTILRYLRHAEAKQQSMKEQDRSATEAREREEDGIQTRRKRRKPDGVFTSFLHHLAVHWSRLLPHGYLSRYYPRVKQHPPPLVVPTYTHKHSWHKL
jgi:hypothetical protein